MKIKLNSAILIQGTIKTPNDGVIEVDKKIALDLISRKRAILAVDTTKTIEPEKIVSPEKKILIKPPELNTEEPDEESKTELEELKLMADQLKVEYDDKTTAEELLAKIDAVTK